MKAFFFIFFFSLTAHAQTDCTYYSRLEAEMKCKEKGIDYLSDYAPYYCEKFLQKSREWKGDAGLWAVKTGKCLQEKLDLRLHKTKLTCLELEKAAFETHSACYSEADVCRLKTGDIIKIMGVIKFKDFIREIRFSSKQLHKLVGECLHEWF